MLTKNQQKAMKKLQEIREMTYEEKWMAIGYLKANLNFSACASELGFSDTTIRNINYIKM